MLVYRGTYRVVYETDKRTGKPTEFTFIPCQIKKGSNICRHSDNTLNVYLTSSIVANNLLNSHPDLFKLFQMGNGEATLLFKESDMERAAVILKPRVMGKNLNPRPKRKMNLSEEQRRIIGERLNTARRLSIRKSFTGPVMT